MRFRVDVPPVAVRRRQLSAMARLRWRRVCHHGSLAQLPHSRMSASPPIPAGMPESTQSLFVEVYDRLKSMASSQLARDGHATLNTTGLVHELYEKMASRDWGEHGGPENFFAYAATAMRNIVTDRARMRLAQKAGGDWVRVTISDHGQDAAANELALDVLELNDGLDKLAQEDPRAARVVELRYFAGLTVDQIAAVMNLNRRTITRDWEFARAYLAALLQK